MAQDSESRSLDKVIVRLPDGMRDRLKAEAEANKRSMNAEIVARLQATLKGLVVTDRADTRDIFRDLAHAIGVGLDDPRGKGRRVRIDVSFDEDGESSSSQSE